MDHIELGVRELIRRDWSNAQEVQEYTEVSLVWQSCNHQARLQLNTQAEECPVCLDEMTEVDSRRLRPCGHRFHNKCFKVSSDSSTGLVFKTTNSWAFLVFLWPPLFISFVLILPVLPRTGCGPPEARPTPAPCAGTLWSAQRTGVSAEY